MSIKIDLKIFLFALIFLLTRQIEIYTLLMIFAFIHELGHLFTGTILGLKPETISIIPTGFSISFKNDCDNYNKKIKNANKLALKKMIVAFAGPLTNIFTIILTYFYNVITKDLYFLNISLTLIIYANILIFIFNMLPIYPLDGGRIFKEIIHIFFGLKKSYYITNKVSNIVTIILTALASIYILIYKNIAILIIILYLWLILIKQNKIFNNKMKLFKLISQKDIEKNEKQ